MPFDGNTENKAGAVRTAMNIPVDLTLFANGKENAYATKQFSLTERPGFEFDEKTKLWKKGADFASAYFVRVTVDGLAGLKFQLERKISSYTLITWGLPSAPAWVQGDVVTQAKLVEHHEKKARGEIGEPPKPLIARDLECLGYEKKPSVMPFDYDPRKPRGKYAPLSWQQLDDAYEEALPGWKQLGRLYMPSCSSFIYSKSGHEFYGPGGWHTYIIVDDGSRIPEVATYIYQRLWSLGYGWGELDSAGRFKDKSIMDMSMYSPNHPDFVAAPILWGDGLVRCSPGIVLLEGGCLMTGGLAPEQDRQEWKRTCKLRLKAEEELKGEAEKQQEKHADKRVKEILKANPEADPVKVKKTLLLAAKQQALKSDFVLYTAAGRPVSVGEILADKKAWNGKRFADPLDPGCYGDWRIAVAVLDTKRPYLWSHAHGGSHYALLRQEAVISVVKGEGHRVVDETLEVLAARDDVFARGGRIVVMNAEGGLTELCEHLLADYTSRCIVYEGKARLDPPMESMIQIVKKRGEGLRRLDGVISAPTMRPDGSLLLAPGYDEATGLYLLPAYGEHGEAPESSGGALGRFNAALLAVAPLGADGPPLAPGWENLTLSAAHAELWHPFQKFPFAGDFDRGAYLAQLLTAVVRAMLPTAPAFLNDASMAGSGKTKLAKCAAILAGAGSDPAVMTPTEGEELRKRLFAELRQGKRAIIIDNVEGTFRSATLAGFLTASQYGDRILQVSQNAEFPNRALTMLTGNNIVVEGDLWRRIVKCSLEPRTDAPEREVFELEPVAYTRKHRMEMTAAALTILKRFVIAGKPRQSLDTTGSFEEWDALIRQCVLWLKAKGFAVDDPVHGMQAMKSDDSEHVTHGVLLDALFELFGEEPFTVADIVSKFTGSSAPHFREALLSVAGERDYNVNAVTLGRWIRSKRNTWLEGKKFTHIGETRRKVALWRVECRS